MTPLQKFPKNVGDLGKLIVTKGFKKLPKVQQITQSGHTDSDSKVHVAYKYAVPFCLYRILSCRETRQKHWQKDVEAKINFEFELFPERYHSLSFA